MANRDLRFKAIMDADDLRKKLGQIERDTGQLNDKLGKFGRGAKTAFGVVAAGGAIQLAGELFNLGSQVEGFKRRFNTVFGTAAGGLATDLDRINERFGVSDERLQGMAAAVGDLLVPMGIARSTAADMSVDVLTLGNALSEFSGGTIDAQSATEAVTKALLGEREQLKTLGVSIKEADVAARLAAKGQSQLTGQALEQAKALATLELITEKSTDALSAYEDGSTAGMSASKEFAAALDDLKVAAATAVVSFSPLLEMMQALPRLMQGNGGTVPALKELFRTSEDGKPVLAAIAGGLGDVGEKARAAQQALSDADRHLFAMAATMNGDLDPAIDDTLAAMAELSEGMREQADKIVSIWKGIPEDIEEFNFGEALTNALDTRQAADTYASRMRALIDLGFTALVEEIQSNPNRHEASAAMGSLLEDVTRPFAIESAVVGRVDAALAAMVQRITGESARWSELAAFIEARGEEVGDAWLRGIARGSASAPNVLQRLRDDFQQRGSLQLG